MPLHHTLAALHSTKFPPPPPPPPQKHKNTQFSTADRTILEELKHTISAHQAQFTTNNSSGTRHHPYPKHIVPYPRSYPRDAVDLDVWETAFCQQICGSLTFHRFDAPPSKVLDIGCGTGTWILNCARAWRKCHFVGLDIVPLHPDLHRVGSTDLASRITWVQANFLEGLPFPNDEFDFVHIKRIARGVPEDKWDPLLEEITRVMKSGGAFEMIEEDLFFPGTPQRQYLDPISHPADSSDSTTLAPQSKKDTIVFPSTQRSPSPPPPVHVNASFVVNRPVKGHRPPPLQRKLSFGQRILSRSNTTPSIITKRPSSAKSSFANAHANPISPPPSANRPSSAKPFYANGSPISPSPPLTKRPSSAKAFYDNTYTKQALYAKSSDVTKSPISTPPPPPPRRVNPWDHSLLERIYIEMHESRFINLAPLSLLANSLNVYFKDVRTHPPLQITFPPQLPRRAPQHRPHAERSRRLGRRPASLHLDCTVTGSNERWVSVRDLLEGTSPFVTMDQARMSAYSPSMVVSFASPDRSSFVSDTPRWPVDVGDDDDDERMLSDPAASAAAAIAPVMPMTSRLPNPTMNFDVRTVNLHVALRTAEVVACAEAMWEWVVEYQRKHQEERARRSPRVVERAHSVGHAVVGDVDLRAIARLSRGDFDGLLGKFEGEMRHHMALGAVLEERFSWTSVSLRASTEYEEWEERAEEYDENKHVPPNSRMGRSLRVFAAWKA